MRFIFPSLSLTGLLLLSSRISVVSSNCINFCIRRWHTVFSSVLDITTNSAPLTWASFPITNLHAFPIHHWVRGMFSSPLISNISPTFHTLFFECFSFLFIWCRHGSFKYTFENLFHWSFTSFEIYLRDVAFQWVKLKHHGKHNMIFHTKIAVAKLITLI